MLPVSGSKYGTQLVLTGLRNMKHDFRNNFRLYVRAFRLHGAHKSAP